MPRLSSQVTLVGRLLEPDREWSAAEVRAAVSDYLKMLAAETAGQPYSKAEHRRRLQGQLSSGRSLQAIKFKHANISAAMIELVLPYIRGYKPCSNYQAELPHISVLSLGFARPPDSLSDEPTLVECPKPPRGQEGRLGGLANES